MWSKERRKALVSIYGEECVYAWEEALFNLKLNLKPVKKPKYIPFKLCSMVKLSSSYLKDTYNWTEASGNAVGCVREFELHAVDGESATWHYWIEWLSMPDRIYLSSNPGISAHLWKHENLEQIEEIIK